MSRITIRAATKKDVDCLSALSIHVFLDTYATTKEVLSSFSTGVFVQRFNPTTSCEIHVAEDHDRMCGFIEYEKTTAVPAAELNGGLEVKTLYIHPKHHRLGTGKALLTVSEEYCKKHSIKIVWLTAWAGNSNAIAFYRHCGFKDIGTTEYVLNDQAYENRILVKHLI